jgi:predicted phosphohydrolase
MKLMWLTDLHLDRASEEKQREFFGRLRRENADAVVITGDISDASGLPGHLRELGQTFGSRPVYFLLGNHDFYGSCFSDVDHAVADVCKEQKNLRHLGHGEIIPLGSGAALVGHRGWADGRAGWGSSTEIPNPDKKYIADLCGLSGQAMFGKLAELGRESAKYFRDILPYALQCYGHVFVATHVPPFTWAAFYNGKPCGGTHLPHYANFSAGCVIRGISKSFSKSRLSVLCGHTHSAANVSASGRVRVIVGQARTQHPQIQRVFEV